MEDKQFIFLFYRIFMQWFFEFIDFCWTYKKGGKFRDAPEK